MLIKKAQWCKNADSPVIFMIDDLANVWIDINNNGKIEPEEDWGHAMDLPNSSFRYLHKKILNNFPDVKTTFFVPLNRAPIVSDHKYNAHFGPINETESLKQFFRNIHNSEKYEIAYHGITHGISGTKNTPFIQEWESYKSLQEALNTIEKGKQLFYETLGSYPLGGKYCGYKKNNFSDESIDKSRFFWWCRDWTRNFNQSPPKELYQIRRFGDNNVIDLPSTVEGNLFNYIEPTRIRQLLKKILKKKVVSKEYIIHEGMRHLDELLKNHQVISIQEHISPARTDGKRQINNIFDDRESLILIFDYLKNKNVWFATGSETAEYFEVFSKTSIIQTSKYNFELNYHGKEVVNNFLTILIEEIDSPFEIKLPDNRIYNMIEFNPKKNSAIINKLPIQKGEYQIIFKI